MLPISILDFDDQGGPRPYFVPLPLILVIFWLFFVNFLNFSVFVFVITLVVLLFNILVIPYKMFFFLKKYLIITNAKKHLIKGNLL